MNQEKKPNKFSVEANVLECNKQAMEHLRNQHFSTSLNLLKKAEEILNSTHKSEVPNRLFAITWNNLGCYYKKTGKNSIALQYLHKAIELKADSAADYTNLAGTHLNICAIRSQMANHEQALKHALQALRLLEEANEKSKNPSVVNSLVIALHNAGVEYEMLSRLKKAQKTFQRGFEIAKKNLGAAHALTKSLQASYNVVSDSIKSKRKGTKNKIRDRASSSDNPRSGILETSLPKIRTSKRGSAYLRRSVESPNSQLFRTSKSSVKTPGSTPHKHNFSPNKYEAQRIKQRTHLERNEKLETLHKQLESVEKRYNSMRGTSTSVQDSYGTKSSNFFSKMTSPKSQSEMDTYPKTPKDKNKSATVIQRYWRSYKQKQFIKQRKRKIAEEKAQTAIQELERLKKEMLEAEKSPKSSFIPSKPQKPSKFRQEKLMPIPESKTETKYDYAVFIQKHIRRFLAQKRFQRTKQAAIVIQKNLRAWQCSTLYQNILSAIYFIQKNWRLHKGLNK